MACLEGSTDPAQGGHVPATASGWATHVTLGVTPDRATNGLDKCVKRGDRKGKEVQNVGQRTDEEADDDPQGGEKVEGTTGPNVPWDGRPAGGLF